MTKPYCNHPKETPAAFMIIRHTFAVLSISIVTVCVYIVKKSPTVSKVYANLLLVGQFSMTSIHC
ncbi:hypothetical protein PRIPAC_85326 [Pristionchus pacificus]|uniref:Uncharacterized protein n=1 Tax=Pristionchus pacificus TaxID=54126 RepID=A0A2A6BKV4_PRIPA|nr:hypothetical protein PRIPAC_85326 [Pristionchus pacificus]|eukprot:PDM66545.1 hypothetical protein PRIPAC_47962 [Pristionchus pacificus]